MEFLRQLFKKGESHEQVTVETQEVAAVTAKAGDTGPAVSLAPAVEVDEVPVLIEPDAAAPAPDLPRAREWYMPPLMVGYASHVGRIRQRNEDSLLAITSLTLGDSALPPYGLFVIADGMGGHTDGQKASQLATRILARDVMSHIYAPFLQIDAMEPAKPVQDILGESIQTANWRVRAINPESGTTLTAALILGERLYLAHVGDSRAYLMREGDSRPEILTLDHSFVQRLQDAGQITAEEAAVHPQRNILYRAIGQGDRLEADTLSRRLAGPGWLLLCSDGLWGVLPPELMQAIITSTATPQQACNELVSAALEAGGPDNISVIVVRVAGHV